MRRDPTFEGNAEKGRPLKKAVRASPKIAARKAVREISRPDCGACGFPMGQRVCFSAKGSASRGCPTLAAKELLASANREYQKPDVSEFARQASLQEAACYANRHERPYVMQPIKTRLEEIGEFAERLDYRRLGLAFCIGLAQEATRVEDILKARGFEVVSVVCKAGKTSKSLIGIKDDEKIFQGTDESMCNPIFQAEILNRSATQFNILLGLCVGHDSLFFRYAQAPTTVLAVKDRVTGHNPLAAIYLADTYYQKLKK